jgi:hypothetical protein
MQLCEQPNSVEGLEDARAKYKFHHQVNAITSRFVAKEHDKTGFRLVCDDFRYENLIVNNDSDLKIISVIDWEWTYAAPYQMFSSAPRWLAVTPPIMWDMPNGFQRIQYHGFLEIFLEELECEERKRIEAQPSLEHNDRLSDLMRESMRNGKFWFHELMYGSFTPANNPAWKVICKMHPDILSTPLPALEVFEDFKIRQRAASKAEWKVVKNKKKKK